MLECVQSGRKHRTIGHLRGVIRGALAVALLAGSVIGTGCASDGESGAAPRPGIQQPGEGFAGVQGVDPAADRERGSLFSSSESPAAAAPKSAVTQLDFFDHLDSRPVVSWDEMLAAILLAANRDASPSYAARLQQARSFGIVGPEAPVDGRTPATPAAFARTLLRAQGQAIPPGIDSTEVVNLAVARKLLPRSVRANDLLSGSTVVQALASVGEPVKRAAGSTATPMARPQGAAAAQPATARAAAPAPTKPAPAVPATPKAASAAANSKPATTSTSSADAFAEFEAPAKGTPANSPPPATPPPTTGGAPASPGSGVSGPGTSNPKPKQPINPELPQPRPEPLPPASSTPSTSPTTPAPAGK
jgi:hypothetical protein